MMRDEEISKLEENSKNIQSAESEDGKRLRDFSEIAIRNFSTKNEKFSFQDLVLIILQIEDTKVLESCAEIIFIAFIDHSSRLEEHDGLLKIFINEFNNKYPLQDFIANKFFQRLIFKRHNFFMHKDYKDSLFPYVRNIILKVANEKDAIAPEQYVPSAEAIEVFSSMLKNFLDGFIASTKTLPECVKKEIKIMQPYKQSGLPLVRHFFTFLNGIIWENFNLVRDKGIPDPHDSNHIISVKQNTALYYDRAIREVLIAPIAHLIRTTFQISESSEQIAAQQEQAVGPWGKWRTKANEICQQYQEPLANLIKNIVGDSSPKVARNEEQSVRSIAIPAPPMETQVKKEPKEKKKVKDAKKRLSAFFTLRGSRTSTAEDEQESQQKFNTPSLNPKGSKQSESRSSSPESSGSPVTRQKTFRGNPPSLERSSSDEDQDKALEQNLSLATQIETKEGPSEKPDVTGYYGEIPEFNLSQENKPQIWRKYTKSNRSSSQNLNQRKVSEQNQPSKTQIEPETPLVNHYNTSPTNETYFDAFIKHIIAYDFSAAQKEEVGVFLLQKMQAALLMVVNDIASYQQFFSPLKDFYVKAKAAEKINKNLIIDKCNEFLKLYEEKKDTKYLYIVGFLEPNLLFLERKKQESKQNGESYDQYYSTPIKQIFNLLAQTITDFNLEKGKESLKDFLLLEINDLIKMPLSISEIINTQRILTSLRQLYQKAKNHDMIDNEEFSKTFAELLASYEQTKDRHYLLVVGFLEPNLLLKEVQEQKRKCANDSLTENYWIPIDQVFQLVFPNKDEYEEYYYKLTGSTEQNPYNTRFSR